MYSRKMRSQPALTPNKKRAPHVVARVKSYMFYDRFCCREFRQWRENIKKGHKTPDDLFFVGKKMSVFFKGNCVLQGFCSTFG